MSDKIIISKNTVLAFLILSAVMLSCAWGLISERSFVSSPVGATGRAGYYVVVTTASPNLGPDMLWIANVNSQELIVFGTGKDGKLTSLASADLNRAFAARAASN